MKLYVIKIIRLIMKAFRIFPVNMRKLVFISYNGKGYSCNPKAITEYILKNASDKYKIIWIINDQDKYLHLKKHGIIIYKKNTLQYLYHIMTARIIISNMNIASIFPKLRQKQYFINTWHGGGAYKRVSDDVDKDKTSMLKTKMIAEQISLFISSNRRFSEVMSNATKVPYNRMWEIGLPRNDIFFEENNEIRKNVRKIYGIDEDSKIILYAPTYRSKTSINFDYENIDIELCLKSLKEKFLGNWHFFYRAHYFINEISENKMSSNKIKNVSDYDDMQELLYASDILITDYSSSMWDYSLTGKPCFIYATDLLSYQQERDFYTPIDKWPFPVAINNEDLSKNILEFDVNKYINKLKQHHNDLGSFETGSATEKVFNFIYEKCK